MRKIGPTNGPAPTRRWRNDQNDWVVQWAGQTIVRGPDLALALAQARDKVRAAVAEMARAVGLEVVGG